MGARKGQDYINRLQEEPPEIWYKGEKVEDVTEHPGFRNGVRSIAELYDVQWEDPDKMLFESPTSGEKVGRSFMIPRTREDLESVGRMMKAWGNHHHGFLGRAPDYLNRAITGYAGGAEFLEVQDPRFPENMRRYHEYIRENDLCLTHTLITPQANRSKETHEQADPYLAARIKDERDDGIVIRGARMLATLPMADEIMVFPSTVLKSTEEDAPYAFGLAVPSSAPGLRFICRESLDYGRSHYDHPLGSRFEEMDAVVVFDDVFVPWERIFLYQDVEVCNQAYHRTGALVNMAHQVVVKNVAKTEYLMGLSALMARTIGIEVFQHIQEKMAKIWVTLEALRAFWRTSEVDAQLDEYGVMRPAWDPLDAARNFYPHLYGELIEYIRQMGASGLVAAPTKADVEGPLQEDIEKYYQAARADAYERIPIFRLAWDTSMSAFANRQELYERYFFGDPVRMAGALVKNHHDQIDEYMERVRDFLERSREEAEQAAADVA